MNPGRASNGDERSVGIEATALLRETTALDANNPHTMDDAALQEFIMSLDIPADSWGGDDASVNPVDPANWLVTSVPENLQAAVHSTCDRCGQRSSHDSRHVLRGSKGVCPLSKKRKKNGTAPRKLSIRGNILELKELARRLQEELDIQKRKHDLAASTYCSAWRVIAAHQRQQRLAAEVDNVKLRTAVEKGLKLTQQLKQSIFHTNPSAETFLSAPSAISSAEHNGRCKHSSLLVSRLHHSLFEMYDRVESILGDARFRQSITPVRDVTVRKDEDVGLSVEYITARVCPFEFQHTSDTFWHLSSDLLHAVHRAQPEELHTTEDATTLVFKLSVREFSEFQGTMVTRRFVASDRVVIVWRLELDQNQAGSIPMGDSKAHFQGWDVLEPAKELRRLGTGEQSTSLRSFVETTFDVHGGLNRRRLKAHQLTDFVVALLDVHRKLELQAMENSLLETMA